MRSRSSLSLALLVAALALLSVPPMSGCTSSGVTVEAKTTVWLDDANGAIVSFHQQDLCVQPLTRSTVPAIDTTDAHPGTPMPGAGVTRYDTLGRLCFRPIDVYRLIARQGPDSSTMPTARSDTSGAPPEGGDSIPDHP